MNILFLKIFYVVVLACIDGPCLYQLLHWGLQSDDFPIIFFLYFVAGIFFFLAKKYYFLVTLWAHGFLKN